MKTFKHITPVSRVFCGPDCMKNLSEEVSHAGGSKVLVFCDPFVASDGKLLSLVKAELGDRYAGTFTNIQANSPLPAVMEGAEKIRQLDADVLVAIGGGSTIVTTRAADVIASEKEDIHKLCTYTDENGKQVSRRLFAPKIPQILIPTSPTTATSKAGAAVLEPETNKLLQLFDPKNRAHSIFIHPDAALNPPEKMMLGACISTFCVAIDGLMSKSGDPMADALLIHAVRIMAENLADTKHLNEAESRTSLMMASILCGMGSDYTGTGLSIVIGHASQAHFPVNPGLVNAIVLPYCLRFNASAEEGMKKLAAALDISSTESACAGKVAARMEEILRGLNLPEKLSELGMTEDKFEDIAENAMHDWYLQFNPVEVSPNDIVHILELAF